MPHLLIGLGRRPSDAANLRTEAGPSRFPIRPVGQAAAQTQIGLGKPDPLTYHAVPCGTAQFQSAVRPKLPSTCSSLLGGGDKEGLAIRQEGQGGHTSPRCGDPQASGGLAGGWFKKVDLDLTPLGIVPGVIFLAGVVGGKLAAQGNPLTRAGDQERLDGGWRKITQGTQGPGEGSAAPILSVSVVAKFRQPGGTAPPMGHHLDEQL